MFINIYNEFNNRKEEINNYFNHLHFYETDEINTIYIKKEGYTINKTTLYTNLKSSMILMLYNLVEAITSKCIQEIHFEINNSNKKYNDFNKEIKLILVRYYYHCCEKKNDINNITKDLTELIEFTKENRSVSIEYENFIKFYPMISGNLDAREIRKILQKYGLKFLNECPKLKLVKDYRNKLAHGEMSFEEVGRDLSFEELQVMLKETFSFMDDMINSVDEFITKKKYLNKSSSNRKHKNRRFINGY